MYAESSTAALVTPYPTRATVTARATTCRSRPSDQSHGFAGVLEAATCSSGRDRSTPRREPRGRGRRVRVATVEVGFARNRHAGAKPSNDRARPSCEGTPRRGRMTVPLAKSGRRRRGATPSSSRLTIWYRARPKAYPANCPCDSVSTTTSDAARDAARDAAVPDPTHAKSRTSRHRGDVTRRHPVARPERLRVRRGLGGAGLPHVPDHRREVSR